MNNIVRIIPNAQDINANPLKNSQYKLVMLGKFYSIIQDENNKQYYVNNKYIEKLPRS